MKMIRIATLSLGLFALPTFANEGPNPCQWEHEPKPGICTSMEKFQDQGEMRKNNIVPVKKKGHTRASERRGGDR